MMKVLIIRLSSIGDIILCSAAVRCISQQLNAQIDVISKGSFQDVWKGNPYVKRIWKYEEQKETDFEELKQVGYDRIFDMHLNFRTARITRKVGRGASILKFNKLNVEKWLMVQFKWNQLPALHLVDRYFEALKAWNVVDDGAGLDYFNIESYSSPIPKKFIVLVLGAAHATKMMTVSLLESICEASNVPVVLVGGPNESNLGKRLQESFPEKVLNTAGLTSLGQSAYLIDQAECVITPDTGMMHMAAALQKPISVVWGNTIPEFGMYPYYGEESDQKFTSHEVDIRCRPCSKIGFKKCPKGHFKCMTEHDGSSIATAQN